MESITYECGGYRLQFEKADGTLKKIAAGIHQINMDSVIWKLTVKNNGAVKEVTLHSNLVFSHSCENNVISLCWQNTEYRVTVTVGGKDSGLKWAIKAESFTKGNGIYKVIFPIIGEIEAISENGENDYLVLPWQTGWLIRNPVNTLLNKNADIPFWAGRGGSKYENEYPAQYSYQFTAYYSPGRFGLYFCMEDGEAYIKTMGYYSRTGGFDFAVTNYPENMGETYEYCMPYKFAFRIFEGDWQTAAELYRSWAKLQKWCRVRLSECKLPDDLAKTDLWRINHTNYKLGTRTQEYFDTSMALKEKVVCNIALHWYGWNMGEHDVNYPEYIRRELKDWPEQLSSWNKKFTDSGIVKIPYVNARLWDIHSPSWTDENAVSAAIKDERGQMPDEPWNPTTVLAPMCPSAPLWQDKVKDFGSRIICKYGFDGLYIDQVASYNATLCFDKTHPHPAGGGKWWNDSYHEMISGLRKIVGNDKILTSESCCETYIDIFNLFLTLDTNFQRNFLFTEYKDCETIPLFSMIYGDYALSYGSICRFSDTLEVFEFNFMRNLLWGILPAVEGVDIEQLNGTGSQGYIDILKKGVSFYKNNKEIILFGRLTGIPQYDCEMVNLCWTPKTGKNFSKRFQSVMAAIWQDPDGGQYCFAYNLLDKSSRIKIRDISIELAGKEIKKTCLN